MTNPSLPTIDPIGYIRTYVPWAIGAILGYLITRFELVANAIAWLDSTLPVLFPGSNWRDLLNLAAIGTVTALYYWGARKLGQKWPKIEKWLLGSSATPVYTAK